MRPFLRCALCPSSAAFTCASVALGTSSARRRRNCSRSPRGERRDPPQHTAVPRSTRSDRAVPLSLWLSLFAFLRAALRELLSIRDAQAPEQVGRSLRLARGTHEPAVLLIIARAFFWFSFFSPLPLPGAAGQKIWDRPWGGEVLRVLY